MSQATFPRKMTAAVAGQLADSSMLKDAVSAHNEEASAEIPFGIMVAVGTETEAADGSNGALKLAATDDTMLGITLRTPALDIPNELGDTGMKPECLMSVVTRGRMWVLTEDVVAVGDPVRVRAVAASNEVAGAFRAAADGTDCIDISAFARWVDGSLSDASWDAGEAPSGIALLEFDMTGQAQAVADV